jgi:type II secretory pathway pseudopilin PulG
MGAMAAYAIPRLGNAMTKQNVQSARAAFVGLLAQARYTAIQRGGQASLVLSNSTVTVRATNPVTGVTGQVGNAQDLNGRYGVTLSPSSLTLTFDSRGIGTASSQTSVSVTKDTYTMSIVVSAAGRVIQ